MDKTPSSTSSDIVSLLARVREAQGPDREIDANIYAMMSRPHKPWFLGTQADEPETALFFDYCMKWADIPAYTSDLNAIVALIERELPGAVWSIITDFEGYCAGHVAFTEKSFTEQGATPALGTCAAFLSALSTKLSEAAE